MIDSPIVRIMEAEDEARPVNVRLKVERVESDDTIMETDESALGMARSRTEVVTTMEAICRTKSPRRMMEGMDESNTVIDRVNVRRNDSEAETEDATVMATLTTLRFARDA